MRHHRNRGAVFSAAIAALAAAPSALFAQATGSVTATFDSNQGDFVAAPSGLIGPNWFNQNLTNFTSGPGEIGGTVVRDNNNPVYLADPTIGPGGNGPGLLTLNDPISGSGEFYINSNSGTMTNGAFLIGHMTTTAFDGNMLGVQIADGYRFFAGFKNSGDLGNNEPRRGTVFNLDNPSDDRISVAPFTPYRFTYTYNPSGGSGNGLLHAEVFDSTHQLGYVDIDLLASDRSVGASFSAWGIEQAEIQGSADFRLDNATYTTGTGPVPGWSSPNGGNWFSSSNWIGGVPNGDTDATGTARFGNAITADALVYADSAVTLKKLIFNNGASTYLLAGLGTLTMKADSGSALVDVQAGTHKINLPLIVASDTTVNVAGGATLKISDPVTINAGIDVDLTGDGQVVYESTVTLLGGNNLEIENSTNHIAALSIGNNSTATLSAGGGSNRVLQANALSISTTGGRLNLEDNKLITASELGTWTGSNYDGVTGLIASGKGTSNLWDGASGIVTSQSAAVGSNYTTIGIARASEVLPATATTTALWAGQTVTGGDTLVMYTYGGDANLDGKINVDDYGHIDSSIPIGLTGWFNGDFNYDGKVNVGDYGIIDFNIGIQGAAFASETAAALIAVPEPAGLVASVGFLLIGMSRRRRRASFLKFGFPPQA